MYQLSLIYILILGHNKSKNQWIIFTLQTLRCLNIMNKLWIFACGEPLSIDDKNIRLHRAGKLGKYLAENKLFKIDFFTSTFNHVKKK